MSANRLLQHMNQENVVIPVGPQADTLEEDVLRRPLVRYLRQRFDSFGQGFRHNLVLLGPVGSGKSTVLRHSLAAAPAQLTKICWSLRREPVRDQIRRFTAAVLRGALDAPDAFSDRTVLQHAEAQLPKTLAALQQLERVSTGSADVLNRVLDVIPLVYKERGRPCVLALDEFLHLEELGGNAQAFHELGKRVMTWPFALFALSSSSVSRAERMLRERLNLLFGQFESIPLGSVDTEAAVAWMQRELPGGAHLTILPQFLLHWVGGSPWYLSVLVRRMNELTVLRAEDRVTNAILFQAAWDVLGRPDGALYHWCAGQLERLLQERQGPLARSVLIHIARGARTTKLLTQRCGGGKRLTQALQTLVEADVISRNGACWVIQDQLLACWMAAIAEPELHGQRSQEAAFESFEEALHALWTQWHTVSAQPLTERLTRLFGQFRNETVSLDRKTARLPSFQECRVESAARRGEHYLIAQQEAAERVWCCLIHEGRLEEANISAFEVFCRGQLPKPCRKIIVCREGLDLNARLLAKESGMWVWDLDALNLLSSLYP